MTRLDVDIRGKTYPQVAGTEQRTVIENLKFSLTSNQFVCLVGPSGCGKTTLLNIVGGLDKDFEGCIKITQDRKPDPTIGYVFQNPRLLPWRTARENIELVLQPGENNEQIDILLKAMGLADIAHAYPQRLSLGMSRRVALARAFAIQPDLLIMDEPFVSLDPSTAERVRRLLLEIWEQRPLIVLFVTHDLREAIALSDRVLVLSESPMTVVHDIPVNIPRAQRDDSEKLETFLKNLVADYSELKTKF